MFFVYLLIVAACILIDQLTKLWLYGGSFSLIGDFLWVHSSFNTGAAFSMLAGKVWFFILVAVIASIIIIYLLYSRKWGLSVGSKVGLAIILGGAIGNLIDRIAFGGVRDFIYFKSIDYAIFNFADSFVTIGAVVLGISVIVSIVKAAKKGSTNDKQKAKAKR